MPTFAVRYQYLEHSEQARAERRPAHVEFLRGLRDSGRLYMSGPVDAEPAQALLIFEDTDAAALETRLDQDPFFADGLIAERSVTRWNVFFDPRRTEAA